ncbi:SGNH/GDSL hydrolase family protein [Roseibium sp. RKSG952]|uniref:SGNH/GDSL hydrolase family protein n=1 Tax=Roseibium sp. RKSG952 TaxID=2529384 RepID=UPI0012BBE2C8|nr:SGNH/GDSL hydrolase family protein [Roseibium sp. RKSG952]MTI00865.1 hypothetical protein [Roseibium sp. RKSG952]
MLKNFLLIAISCLITLACVEVLLRVFDPLNLEPHSSPKIANVTLQHQGVHFCEGGPDRLRRHDTVYSRENPLQSYFEFRNDIVSYHKYNENGFRGTTEPEGDKGRILVLGDSFIRGTLSDETETIPALLTRWSEDAHYINLGTGGHGTLQHDLTYREFKDVFPHDTVLMFVFNSNDLTDNVTFRKWQENPTPFGQKQTVSQQLKTKIATFHVGKLVIRLKSMLTNRDLYPSEPTEDETNLFLESLHTLNQAVTDKGARLVVVSLPSVSEFVDEGYVTFRSDPVGYSDAVRALIEQSAGDEGFIWLDLKPGLEAMADQLQVPTVDLFGSPDHHLQEVGNYAVASAVAKFLEENGIDAFEIEDSFVNRMQHAPDAVSCP